MKKFVIIIAILTFNFQLLTLNSFSQPNGGFENWSTVNGIQEPANWQTINFLNLTSPPNPLSAFKATGIDKHSGNYALQIKTVGIINNPAPVIIDDSVGLAFTGKVSYSPTRVIYGFPYTGRPEKLLFWSKYMPVGSDTGGAIVVLQKRNGTNIDTIAFGRIYIGQTGSFTQFEVPLSYYLSAFPDTASIIFGSSLKFGQTRVGSTIYIDDVALTGWVGIDEPDLCSGKVQLFPNPSKDNVNIHVQNEEADNVQVTDASGRAIGVYKIQNYNSNVNTSAFANGFYYYVIRDKKNRILINGKFNVVK